MTKKPHSSVTAPLNMARASLLKVCHEDKNDVPEPSQVQYLLELIDRLSGKNKIFAMILMETGARPIEILNLTAGRTNRNGMVLLRSAKGSADRIAFSPTFVKLIPADCLDKSFKPFSSYSYRRFYRAIRSTGFHMPINKGTHNAVSRLFRQGYAHLIHSFKPGDLDLLATNLGHKNKLNSLFYLKPKGI